MGSRRPAMPTRPCGAGSRRRSPPGAPPPDEEGAPRRRRRLPRGHDRAHAGSRARQRSPAPSAAHRRARSVQRPARPARPLGGGRASFRRPARLGPRLPAQRRRELRSARGRGARKPPTAPAAWLQPLHRDAQRRARLRLALRLCGLRRRDEGPAGQRARGCRGNRAGQPAAGGSGGGLLPQPLRPLPDAGGGGALRRGGGADGRIARRPDAREGPPRARQRPRQLRLRHAGRRLPRVDGLHADHVRAAGAAGGDAADKGPGRSGAALWRVRPHGRRHLLI